jgi:hypothetical protein
VPKHGLGACPGCRIGRAGLGGCPVRSFRAEAHGLWPASRRSLGQRGGLAADRLPLPKQLGVSSGPCLAGRGRPRRSPCPSHPSRSSRLAGGHRVETRDPPESPPFPQATPGAVALAFDAPKHAADVDHRSRAGLLTSMASAPDVFGTEVPPSPAAWPPVPRAVRRSCPASRAAPKHHLSGWTLRRPVSRPRRLLSCLGRRAEALRSETRMAPAVPADDVPEFDARWSSRRGGMIAVAKSVCPSFRLTHPVAHPPSLLSDDFREIRVDKRTLGLRVGAAGWPPGAEAPCRPPMVGPHVFRPGRPGFGPPAAPKRCGLPVRCLPSVGRRAPASRRSNVPKRAVSTNLPVPAGLAVSPLQPSCLTVRGASPLAASAVRAARPCRRRLDPAAALLRSRAVVAVTGGQGAGLATPPGCRHLQRAEARLLVPCYRWASRAASRLNGPGCPRHRGGAGPAAATEVSAAAWTRAADSRLRPSSPAWCVTPKNVTPRRRRSRSRLPASSNRALSSGALRSRVPRPRS